MKHVDLEKFANGAFSAQVNRAIEGQKLFIHYEIMPGICK